MGKTRPPQFVIIMLTLLSTYYIYSHLILPNLPNRITFAALTVSGENVPPYRYRILMPVIAQLIQGAIGSILNAPFLQHIAAYVFIVFVTFWITFNQFYVLLRRLFTEKTALIGLLLLQLLIPLTVTGYYMEDDYITLMFFIIAINLLLSQKEIYLPLLIAIAAFNREQTIFIMVFYGIYMFSQKKITRRTIIIGLASIVAFAAVYIGVRLYFGIVPSPFTPADQIRFNLDIPNLLANIIPLWLAEAGGFVVLCIRAYRRSNNFFRWGLLSLGVYFLLFLVSGHLTEFAKFLPAYVIFIPMSLQALFNEYVDENMNKPALSQNTALEPTTVS
jgi:hypothetical protein